MRDREQSLAESPESFADQKGEMASAQRLRHF